MNKAIFSEGMTRLEDHFHGATFAHKSLSAWFRTLANMPDASFLKAVENIIQSLDCLPFQGNLAAIIVKYSGPILTDHTVAEHISHAVELNKLPDGPENENPYVYLRRLDPALPEIAERCGVFDKSLSADSLRFQISKAAKTFVERRENRKRGYSGPPPASTSRQIEGPRAVEMIDFTKSLEGLRRAKEALGKGEEH